MNIKAMLVVGALISAVAQSAAAREDLLKMPIKDALESAEAKAKLNPDIKLYFGDQKSPANFGSLGEYTSNKKTNFANKSDKEGCEWVFLSAVLALQERAAKEGGNAVVEIVSYYKKQPFSSATEYQCAAGKILGGVALRGKVVKLK